MYTTGASDISVFNDQKALVNLQHNNLVDIPNNRIVRLLDRVSAYDFQIFYIQGKLNYVSDALSTAEVEEAEFPDVPNCVPFLGAVK